MSYFLSKRMIFLIMVTALFVVHSALADPIITRYRITSSCDVKKAFAFNSEGYGIVADAAGGSVKVSMYCAGLDPIQGEIVYDILAYGATTGINSPTLESTPWTFTPFYCDIAALTNSSCAGQVPSTSAFKSVLQKYIQHRAMHSNPSSYWAGLGRIPVVIDLELTDVTLDKVSKIVLPGVRTIGKADLLALENPAVFVSDFSGLFNPNDRVSVAAHRGYWEMPGVVQNSIEAIDAANSIAGMNWIELDIRSSQEKHPIIFHDDVPTKILQDLENDQPGKSVYDLTWNVMKEYYQYDRFNIKSAHKLLDLEQVFTHIRDNHITKPINMDIGIPAVVPQNGTKVDGQPFFDAVFLDAVRLACVMGITNQIVFKGKYTFDDPIWLRVAEVLMDNPLPTSPDTYPRIAYTPKLGDDITRPEEYFDTWLLAREKTMIPWVQVVGMEIRIKNDHVTPINTLLNACMATAHDSGLKVGVFSESPSSCQGYWTKSAKENYVDFAEDHRNDFEWLINKGFDYIITDLPKNLIELRSKMPSSN